MASVSEQALRQEALKWQTLYAEAVQQQASTSAEVAPLRHAVTRLTTELSASQDETVALSSELALHQSDSDSTEHSLLRELRLAEERAAQAWQRQLESTTAAAAQCFEPSPLRRVEEANRRAEAAEAAETRCAAVLLSNSKAVAHSAQLVRQAMATAAAAEADSDEQRRVAAAAESRAEELQARLNQLLGGESERGSAAPPPQPSPLPQPTPPPKQYDEGGQTEAALLRASRQETRRLQLLLEESLRERLALAAKLAHLDPVAASVTPAVTPLAISRTPRTSCDTASARLQKTPRRDHVFDT